MNLLDLINRKEELFNIDITKLESKICSMISQASFLVLGGAGSIGQAVTEEIFKRNPKKLQH